MPATALELDEFLVAEHLPDSYRQQVERYFQGFIEQRLASIRGGALKVLGIHGAQGSGKSTLASFIDWYLGKQGLRVARLSLDDFYLSHAARRDLALSIHPLLQTRGVPGTHDVNLGLDTFARLRALRAGESMPLPRFDKLSDDPYPIDNWPIIEGPVDLIVFEGWCVGALPEPLAALTAPVNALEQREDASGQWRRYANDCLAGDYQRWFSEMDYLLMLAAPGFDCVAGWRTEQEQRLAATQPDKTAMTPAQVARFIQHYERLTRHCLDALPARADCVMQMGRDRRILSMTYRGVVS